MYCLLCVITVHKYPGDIRLSLAFPHGVPILSTLRHAIFVVQTLFFEFEKLSVWKGEALSLACSPSDLPPPHHKFTLNITMGYKPSPLAASQYRKSHSFPPTCFLSSFFPHLWYFNRKKTSNTHNKGTEVTRELLHKRPLQTYTWRLRKNNIIFFLQRSL